MEERIYLWLFMKVLIKVTKKKFLGNGPVRSTDMGKDLRILWVKDVVSYS